VKKTRQNKKSESGSDSIGTEKALDLPQAQHESGPASRRLTCSGCGAEFTCGLSATCWCADESFRLPMPGDNADCLCPDCLRRAAARAAEQLRSDT
jgi:hypothetical protein